MVTEGEGWRFVQVLAMYWVFALVGGCIWVCHVALQDPYENFISRSSHARQLSQLERRLIAASNARVSENDLAPLQCNIDPHDVSTRLSARMLPSMEAHSPGKGI